MERRMAADTKEKRQEEIRNQIFNTVAQLIHELGYEKVTVRMICEKAGISIGMFYRNYKSLDEIFSFFYERAVEEYKAKLFEKLQGDSLKNQLIRYYTWVVEFTMNLGGDFFRHFTSSVYQGAKTDQEENGIVSMGMELINQAVARGEYELPEGRTSMDLTRDFLVIVKGVLYDWSADQNTDNAKKYIKGLLERLAESILQN